MNIARLTPTLRHGFIGGDSSLRAEGVTKSVSQQLADLRLIHLIH